MQTTYILLLTLLLSSVSIDSRAQFYTIGNTPAKRPLQTENPSEQPSATPRDSIADTVGEEPIAMTRSTFALPLKQVKVTSPFGMRLHPVYHKRMMHNGIDLAARFEYVYSMLPGTVTSIGYDERSGHYLIITSGTFSISYCHLSKVYVRQGDFVSAGDIICKSGNTGASTGPHLHLGIKKDGKAINPTILLGINNL